MPVVASMQTRTVSLAMIMDSPTNAWHSSDFTPRLTVKIGREPQVPNGARNPGSVTGAESNVGVNLAPCVLPPSPFPQTIWWYVLSAPAIIICVLFFLARCQLFVVS
jgi:hypothetical protein